MREGGRKSQTDTEIEIQMLSLVSSLFLCVITELLKRGYLYDAGFTTLFKA